jgi:hypothetical protein
MRSSWCNLQVYISYLEIYNEVGYDLLDPTREVQAMEDLPQASSCTQHAPCSSQHGWTVPTRTAQHRPSVQLDRPPALLAAALLPASRCPSCSRTCSLPSGAVSSDSTGIAVQQGIVPKHCVMMNPEVTSAAVLLHHPAGQHHGG